MTVAKSGTAVSCLRVSIQAPGWGRTLRPLRLQAEDEIGSARPSAKRGEDHEGHPCGVGEGEADGGSHERRGAGGGDDGGEDSGEEAAGVALLLREFAA